MNSRANLGSIRAIHRLLTKSETTISSLHSAAIKSIEENRHLAAFISVLDAKDRVEQLEAQLQESKGSELNQLFGVPISIKDNFCLMNHLTTCGSKMLHNFMPPYTASAVQKLLDAGSVVVGKTNMDEFAMGSSCTNSYFGNTANQIGTKLHPFERPTKENADRWYMAGGSSTGSAVSVASGTCFASLATDTGGSTRQPASMTGIVGFKPTYGLISRYGLIPLAHCLDVVSILTREVDDARIVFDTVVGQDQSDLTSVDHKIELLDDSFSEQAAGKTITVGVPSNFIGNSSDTSEPVIKRFDEVLKHLGSASQNGCDINFKLVEVKLPQSSLATECYTIISSAEIASNMSCYDGVKYGFSTEPKPDGFNRDEFYRINRDLGFGTEVKKRILLGNYFLLSENRDRYLMQALKLRRMIHDEFRGAFETEKIDVILMPSTPTTSTTYEEWLQKQDDNKLFREDYFLIPSNLANLPSISLPCGKSELGLPIGLQLIANKFHDLRLLSIAKIFESRVTKIYDYR